MCPQHKGNGHAAEPIVDELVTDPGETRRIEILTFSTVFPSNEMPRHGVFVAERLRHLVASGRVSARVIAPVPWFPSGNPRFGAYARYANVVTEEVFSSIRVQHPRYVVVPKVGMAITPYTLAIAGWAAARRLLRAGDDFHVVDAHYFYPDGVAAAMLSRWVGKPLVITARGTDINLIPEYRIPRGLIRWAAEQAGAVVTVSDALRERLAEIGVDAEKIRTLRNGVDGAVYRPVVDRSTLRHRLGIDGYCLLSVGRLVKEKGHHDAISALRFLPNDVRLVIAGEGPIREYLETLVKSLSLTERVTLLGELDQTELIDFYNAADALILASRSEGMPNVVLESLACGTPVISNDVGGVSEIIHSPEAGILIAGVDPETIAGAVRRLRGGEQRSLVRKFSEAFSWDNTTRGQLAIFEKLLGREAA
jgi:glycosyltransferase involved in cell wall biosynthesis